MATQAGVTHSSCGLIVVLGDVKVHGHGLFSILNSSPMTLFSVHFHTYTLDLITTQISSASEISYLYLLTSIYSLSFLSPSIKRHSRLQSLNRIIYYRSISSVLDLLPFLFNLGSIPRSLSSTTLFSVLFSIRHIHLVKSHPQSKLCPSYSCFCCRKVPNRMYATRNSSFLPQLDLESLPGNLLSIIK